MNNDIVSIMMNRVLPASKTKIARFLFNAFIALFFSSCITTSVIRSATGVSCNSASRYDSFDKIDSVYFIRDSAIIVKIKGQNFYDAKAGVLCDSMYYTIPLTSRKRIKQKPRIRFGTNRVIRNNDRQYKVGSVFTYRMVTVFEKVFSSIYIYQRNHDSIDGWNSSLYVYNLKRKHEAFTIPKINTSAGCRRYGNMKKEFTTRKRMVYGGTFIGRKGHRHQTDKDTVLEEISGGYYFPLSRDTIFFYDKSMYNSSPNGYKFRIIPKEERSFGFCFVNRKETSYKVVYVNIPRSYNKVDKPARLLLLPFSIIADIPLQVLWLPFGAVIGIGTGYGCIPLVERFRK